MSPRPGSCGQYHQYMFHLRYLAWLTPILLGNGRSENQAPVEIGRPRNSAQEEGCNAACSGTPDIRSFVTGISTSCSRTRPLPTADLALFEYRRCNRRLQPLAPKYGTFLPDLCGRCLTARALCCPVGQAACQRRVLLQQLAFPAANRDSITHSMNLIYQEER